MLQFCSLTSEQNLYGQKGGSAMNTYEYEKVWSDYKAGRMEGEMALGHTLQHVGKLYEAMGIVTKTQRSLQEQFTQLANEVKTLGSEANRVQKAADLDRLSQLVASFTLSKRALANLRVDVDRLLAHTGLPPSPKGKPKLSKPDGSA